MMDSAYDPWLRMFLAFYFTFVACFYACRLLLSKRRSKLLFVGNIGSSHWWGHMAFRVFRLIIWGVCVTRVFLPGIDRFLVPFSLLHKSWLQGTGVVMLVAGFAVALVGHGTLSDHWRSGIDPAGPSRLVISGLYGFSRNPMYLGVITAQSGFFLAMPSLFTLACLVVGFVAISNQVRLEEIHLQKAFAGEYGNYAEKVRRWLPINLSN